MPHILHALTEVSPLEKPIFSVVSRKTIVFCSEILIKPTLCAVHTPGDWVVYGDWGEGDLGRLGDSACSAFHGWPVHYESSAPASVGVGVAGM